MDNLFEMPPQITTETLDALYSYLQQMADRLNEMNNFNGGTGLTDSEMRTLSAIVSPGDTPGALDKATAEYLSLKSLIIKTATWVQSAIDEWRTTLQGQYLSKSNLGTYSKDTKMEVVMDSQGEKRTFTLKEMIQGEQSFEITAKGYIKQGYLYDEGALPVYGIAIGKELVKFEQDGQTVYHGENRVATFTADEVAFWTQDGGSTVKLASYTDSGVTIYVAGRIAAMYTSNGFRLYQPSGSAGAYTMRVLPDASLGFMYEPILG